MAVATWRDLQGRDESLEGLMDFYFEDKRLVPSPSAMQQGEENIPRPPSAASKILLLNEMILQRVTPSELARRMKTIPQEINRLIDLHHTSKIDRVSQALHALGRRLELQIA